MRALMQEKQRKLILGGQQLDIALKREMELQHTEKLLQVSNTSFVC